MSAFYILKEDDFVTIVSDTLNVTSQEGDGIPMIGGQRVQSPVSHMKKTATLPTKNMLMASTGFSAFFLAYYQTVCLQVPGNDPVGVNEVCPPIMQKLWRQMKGGLDTGETPGGNGQMIYQMGYSPSEDRFCGWRYHSEKDFEPQPMGREWIQPMSDEAKAALTSQADPQNRAISFFKCLKEMEREGEMKIGVGGTVWMHTLRREGFGIKRLHTFEENER